MLTNEKVRVLVIGSSDYCRDLLASQLPPEKYRLITCPTASQCIEELDSNAAHVVFIDLAGTVEDSHSALAAVQSACHAAPIVACIGENDQRTRDALAEQGVRECLTVDELETPALNRAIDHAYERERLESELRNAQRQSEALAARGSVISNIGRIVSSTSDMNDVMGRFAEEAQRLLPFDRMSIWLVEGGAIAERYSAGVEIVSVNLTEPAPLQGSVTELIIERPNGVLLSGEDLLGYPDARERVEPLIEQGLVSFLCVPLQNRGSIIGVLVLASRDDAAYGEPDLKVLKEIADQIAGPAALAESLRKMSELASKQATIAVLGQTISRSLELAEVLRASKPLLTALLPASHVTVNLVNHSRGSFIRHYIVGGEIPGYPSAFEEPLEGSKTGEIIETSAPVIFTYEELSSELNANSGLRQAVESGIRSFMVVPLKVEGSSIGTIAWAEYQPDRFSPEDLDLAITISMQLAGAIANCALHERTIEAAEERAAMEHLQSANKELAIANEIKAQLISNVSHELRTPLTSMLAFADMLNRDRQGVLTDQYKDMVRLIRRSGRQLDLLISDLLMMSRLQTGEFKLSYEQFRLQDLVDEVAGVISSITESKRQPINIELDDPQLLIEADRSRVAQVLLNILSNASKYSDEGSPIGLKATEEGGRALLSVQDHGHGMSAEEKSRIFQRFSRLDNDATRGAPGTGLGLSIVKTLVDLHCGSVEVESEPGAGTTFTVAIPLKAVGAHSERAA